MEKIGSVVRGFWMQLDDWSALGTAVRCRDAASVATLLAGGADVNEQFLERRRGVGRGSSALRYAVSLDEGPIVKLLLAAGARADEHFSLGGSTYTPLSLAQERNKTSALSAFAEFAAEQKAKQEAKTEEPVKEEAKSPRVQSSSQKSSTFAKAEEPVKEEAKSPRVQSSSQKSSTFASQIKGQTGSQMMKSQTGGNAQKSQTLVPAVLARGGVSPRLTQKLTGAAISYADLQLGSEIGKGAYGRVLEGTYGGRKVACKVMSMLKDEKEQEQLRREIQLQFSAKHPNIVEMIGLSKDADKNLVIVMELVDGGDLLTLLKNASVTLEWPLRAQMARQIAGAIAFLHARNVVHRDLKSENILVDVENNAKLCDFGFARAVETRGRASTVLGSPYYMAPEQLLGKQYDASKTDVFAFGILLLELVTRRTVNIDRINSREPLNPAGIDTAGLLKKIPKTLNVPPPMLKLALVCIEYNPEKRPTMKQAEQMATAIEKAIAPK